MEEKKIKGYAMLPCFTVEITITEDGNSCDMTCNDFLFWFFRIFFAPFWDGKIYLDENEN